MGKVDPIAAPIFFFLFVLVVVLVALNVFIAILSDGYSVAKDRIEREKTERTFQSQSFIHHAKHILKEFIASSITLVFGRGKTGKVMQSHMHSTGMKGLDIDISYNNSEPHSHDQIINHLVPDNMRTGSYQQSHRGGGGKQGGGQGRVGSAGGGGGRKQSQEDLEVEEMMSDGHISKKEAQLITCQRRMYREFNGLDTQHKELLANFMFNQHTLTKEELETKLECEDLAQFVGSTTRANALLLQFDRMHNLLERASDPDIEDAVQSIEEQVKILMVELQTVKGTHYDLLSMQHKLLEHHGIDITPIVGVDAMHEPNTPTSYKSDTHTNDGGRGSPNANTNGEDEGSDLGKKESVAAMISRRGSAIGFAQRTNTSNSNSNSNSPENKNSGVTSHSHSRLPSQSTTVSSGDGNSNGNGNGNGDDDDGNGNEQWTKLSAVTGMMVRTAEPEDTADVLNRTTLLLACNAIAVSIFVTALSGVGYGVEMFDATRDYYYTTYYCLTGAAFLMLSMYLLDFSYWDGSMIHVKNLLLFTTGCATCAGSIVATRHYPVAPLGMFVCLVPYYVGMIKKLLYTKTDLANFMHCVAFSLTVTGMAVCAGWCYWWYSRSLLWTGQTKLDYSIKLRCDTIELTNKQIGGDATPTPTYAYKSGEGACMAAFLVWVSPFMIGIACLIFGSLCYFLAIFLTKRRGIQAAVRVFGGVISVGLFGMWVAASIASASTGVADLIVTCSILLIGMTGCIIAAVMGFDFLKIGVMQNPFLRKIVVSDWVKALGVVTMAPPFILYLCMSVINQFFRVKFAFAKTVTDPLEQKLWLTLVASRQLKALRKWRWTSVCVKVVWLGLIFICVDVVVGKVTTMTLSWLNDWIKAQAFGLPMVTAVFVLVGLVMFLLPPVPGVPVSMRLTLPLSS